MSQFRLKQMHCPHPSPCNNTLQSTTSSHMYTHNKFLYTITRLSAEDVVSLTSSSFVYVAPFNLPIFPFSNVQRYSPCMLLPSLALPRSFESLMLAFTFPTTLQELRGGCKHLIKPLRRRSNQR